jgi:deoxycytidine triphosphate deaminase
MLSDIDIKEAMENGDIKIEPFEIACLTAVGYDLRLGISGFSLTNQEEIDIFKRKGVMIAPHEMVIVTSKEEIQLSKKISGTIHAQVKRLNQGLQAISATADPDWHGFARLHLTNNLDREIFIAIDSTIATICFYKLDTPTELNSLEPQLKTVDWNTLLAGSLNRKEKIQNGWKYRLFSTKFKYLIALLAASIISGIVYAIFKPSTEAIGVIFTALSLVSAWVIEMLK